MRIIATLSALALVAPVAAAPERLGTVSFATTCAPSVRAPLNRGVALLHDFWYDAAQRQFEEIAESDPACALAHWGIAMSVFHQIWNRTDERTDAFAWKEMQQAHAPPAKSPREREYIDALSVFFRPDKRDYQTRTEQYSAAMARLHEHYPDDVDATAFYALSLLASIPQNDTSLTQQRHALALLTPLFESYPGHPGLAHYIIHASDSPALAQDGLVAAQRYGEIAGSAPHAAHMPAHIFARLGMWQADIDANLASVAASQSAQQHHLGGAMDQLHASEFLMYAFLQRGQDAHAKEILDSTTMSISRFDAMPEMTHDWMKNQFPYYRVKFPVFYLLERRDWNAAAAFEAPPGTPPESQTLAYWARMIASGHLHKADQARADAAVYEGLVAEVRQGKFPYFVDGTGGRIEHGEALAWAAFAEGRTGEALKLLRENADLQDRVGQGEVDIPAREMLADMLLESAQPQAAMIEYDRALQLSPKRFNGLFNAGKAAEAVGAQDKARDYYSELLQSTNGGDQSLRPEIAYAKSFVARLSR